MQRDRQLFEAQLAPLRQRLVQMEAELTIAAKDRDALHGQLVEYVVSGYMTLKSVNACLKAHDVSQPI